VLRPVTQRTHETTPLLDRVRWPAGFVFECHGAIIGVRSSSRSVLGALRRVLPPDARISSARPIDSHYSIVVRHDRARPNEPLYVAYERRRRIGAGRDVDAVVATLEGAVHLAVALHARTMLFVHAGVVGWRGGAIVIPGRTHTGKSSLVAALLRAGATYYSDEYALFDGAGRVHAFPKSLGIRDAGGTSRPVSPVSLGATTGDVPLPLHTVIATSYTARASWRPVAMSGGETVLALFDNTVAAQRRPADAIRTLSIAVTGARALRGVRGDAARIAERILDRCSEPSL
jgi:hypothetical protein